jgi:hypothetical protein
MANNDLNPQLGIQGTSSLYKFNSSPNTRAVISQKVRILTPAYGGDAGLLYQIGVVNSFDAGSSSRDTSEIRGVGFGDQIAELVPGITQKHSATAERALLYLSNNHQAFGYAGGVDGPVRTLQHHRWPFDVEQQTVFSSIADAEANGSTAVGLKSVDFSGQNVSGAAQAYDGQEGRPDQSHRALITYYEGCWITEASFGGVTTDGGVISTSCNFDITDVHDLYSTYGEFLATGNDPTINQGASILYSNYGDDPLLASVAASRSSNNPNTEAGTVNLALDPEGNPIPVG